jgi:alpha-galactosidase
MKNLLPLAALCALFLAPSVRADEVAWLSSLDLTKATQGFGKPQADKSVDGHPLTLGGHTYAHGFGTHARGLLAVALDGGTRRFTATVGIDDEVGGGKGSAEFQVLGDDHKTLWTSGIMRQGQPPKVVDVDLTGRKLVLLRVTDGGDGYEFDHADWADAQFDITGARPRTVALTAQEPVISMTGASPLPEIHGPAVVGIRPGTPLLWTIPATGARPLTFSARGLPKGLALSPAGTITGTLARPGDYAVRVTVRNDRGMAGAWVHLIAGPTLARTPPLGWNSYDAYGSNVNEAQTLANARYLAEKMQPYGWQYVVVDYRWYDPASATAPDNGAPGEALTMDDYGRLLPAPHRFPSAAGGRGFKGLADRIHALGLRFGIHIMRGIPRNAVKANLPIEGSSYKAADAANTADTCPWCPDMYGVRGDTPAGQAYYDSLFRLYASWGVDFVKMDDTSAPYHADEIEAVRRAIDKCGRSIVYSLSPGETPLTEGAHVAAHANMWRESGDFWDGWNALDHEFTLGAKWQPYAAPGHWPDGDMLPLGHLSLGGRPVGTDRRTHFSRNEQMTLLSLWSLLPSPLMVGANLPDNDPWTLALLTNPEVLAVNQDPLGAAGKPISQSDGLEVWSKKMADGSLAVGLFNRGELEDTVVADWSKLGITGRYAVRDLWQRKDLGLFNDKYAASVPSHGAMLLRLTMTRPINLRASSSKGGDNRIMR